MMFDDLLDSYRLLLGVNCTTHEGDCRNALRGSVNDDAAGVYVIHDRILKKVLYIGSSGKISPDLTPSKSTVKNRLFNANTPYHFDKNEDVWRYNPTSSGVPPKGYQDCINLSALQITILRTPPNMIPAALEHILIQGYINQYAKLPTANQKI